MTEHEERLQQLKDIQKVALTRKEEFVRPVVIGDVLDELNERAKQYGVFAYMNTSARQDRAMLDFQKFITPDIYPIAEPKDDIYFARR